MVAPKKNGKKILIVLYYYHPYVSGVSVSTKGIAEGLAQKGYIVTVLTSRFDRQLPVNEIVGGVRVVRRPVWWRLNKGVIMPLFWLDIVRYGRKNDYINLVLPMADSGISSLFLPKQKMISTYHCDINLGKDLLSRLITALSLALMRLQLQRSRVVIPSSRDYLLNSSMSRYIDKATPVYPTITVSDFQKSDPSTLFERLKIGKDTMKIGFVGRIVYEKGIDYLIESIPYIQKEISRFKILIAGDYKNVAGGSVKDQLDHYMAEYPNRIIFTGYLNDKERNEFYSGLDVFVLPSIDPLEAFGMVQVEAMLCGAPVVATDLPGVREVIRKTGYGRIAKLKDSRDLGEQIVSVLTNRKKYLPDPRRVAELYDPKRAVEAYERALSN